MCMYIHTYIVHVTCVCVFPACVEVCVYAPAKAGMDACAHVHVSVFMHVHCMPLYVCTRTWLCASTSPLPGRFERHAGLFTTAQLYVQCVCACI